MKLFFLTLVFTLMALPAFAACADTQNAAAKAVRERNALVKGSINVTMPDPEDVRGPLSDCLNSIHGIGDVFSLGVSFPSMEQIIAGMCRQVDSMIQEKINDVLSEAHSTVNEINRNNPFQVSGDNRIGVSISGRIK
jgi:hypothetical protein